MGRFRANQTTARFLRDACINLNYISRLPGGNVIDRGGPRIPGGGVERQRRLPLCPRWGRKGSGGLPCAPGRSPREAASGVQGGAGRSRKSRSLLCDAHCWAPRDVACALRMCGTSVYYDTTSHSMSINMLAHEIVDGALHCLHAGVSMAHVYVRVLAWCNVHCAYSCANSCVCAIVCVRLYA